MFDYNTRLVMISSTLLGIIAGVVGVYLLLRRKSLIADTICHAALPGLAASFLVQIFMGGNGRSLFGLLVGAALSGGLSAVAVSVLGRVTKLKPDAILGIVLSVFFGVGMTLFSVIQQIPDQMGAGLETYILGKSASIINSDLQMIVAASLFVTGLVWLTRKELQILCFDPLFASASGWPAGMLDAMLLGAVLVVVIVGASVVGVILVVALMVTPPVAARFWTNRLSPTILISALIGGLSGIAGTLISLYGERLPTGPCIVLVATGCFVLSLFFGIEKGILWRYWTARKRRALSDVEHVLRSIYELLETRGTPPQQHGQIRSAPVDLASLKQMRTWGKTRLSSVVRTLASKGWITINPVGDVILTAGGIQESLKSVRRHRLLEIYFSNLAVLSPAALDRGADALEHDLDDDMLAALEQEFFAQGQAIQIPESVHPIPATNSN
ncbi:MAG: iron chelate uptake ABC transporter family permease subunit [Pirellula sp.]|jgi:manganese/zinc/iron transport system permease protein